MSNNQGTMMCKNKYFAEFRKHLRGTLEIKLLILMTFWTSMMFHLLWNIKEDIEEWFNSLDHNGCQLFQTTITSGLSVRERSTHLSKQRFGLFELACCILKVWLDSLWQSTSDNLLHSYSPMMKKKRGIIGAQGMSSFMLLYPAGADSPSAL